MPQPESALSTLGESNLAENLGLLAEHAFGISGKACSGCNGYHALWGYERLAGIKNPSFEADRDIVEPLIRAHAGKRILIAGAADAGLLAMTACAMRAQPVPVTVADRCETPLSVCRTYAKAHGLAVTTAKVDLTQAPLDVRHDLAFAHNILMLIPLKRHLAFLRNIRASLALGGTFVLVNRVRLPKTTAERLPPSHYAQRILEALKRRDVVLPESEAAFRGRLEAYAEAQHVWSDAVVTQDHVEALLKRAGFTVAEQVEHFRRTSIPDRDGGAPTTLPTHIYVARAA